MQEQVVLVNKNDKEIGYMDKLEAHQKGILHRAISVFIFNSNGKMLIQRRKNGGNFGKRGVVNRVKKSTTTKNGEKHVKSAADFQNFEMNLMKTIHNGCTWIVKYGII